VSRWQRGALATADAQRDDATLETITSHGVNEPRREHGTGCADRMIPLWRRVTPEEVARWIVALADPAADWITGQIISVDGGLGIS
jgi:NAD(P)-dependent dehydrogenase (short-subunit alcohol dehydrogenase family)